MTMAGEWARDEQTMQAPQAKTGTDGFGLMAHQIVAQLSTGGANLRAVRTPEAEQAPAVQPAVEDTFLEEAEPFGATLGPAPSHRPELATALTSVSRAADLLLALRTDLANATARADEAEIRIARLQSDLADRDSRLAGVRADYARERERAGGFELRAEELGTELADATDRLATAEKRAEQAEDNLQHLLKVVLERLKV